MPSSLQCRALRKTPVLLPRTYSLSHVAIAIPNDVENQDKVSFYFALSLCPSCFTRLHQKLPDLLGQPQQREDDLQAVLDLLADERRLS